MPSKDSISLIGNPEGYSGGAFQTGSTMLWHRRNQPREASADPTPTTRPHRLGWHTPASGLAHLVEFHDPQTTGDLPDHNAIQLRIMCHFLLDALPSEGLEEVCEAIRDTYVFHLEHIPSTYSLPVRQTVKSGVGRSYERPIFSLSEEDE